jgi:hypothetical protein
MRKKRKTKKKAWGVHRLPPYPVRVADPVGQGHHGRQVQASPSAADTCCVLLDLRRERLGDTVVVAPIVVETWTHAPVHCARPCTSHSWRWMLWWAPTRLPIAPEGLTRPSGDAKVCRGGQALPCLRHNGRARRRLFLMGQVHLRPSG